MVAEEIVVFVKAIAVVRVTAVRVLSLEYYHSRKSTVTRSSTSNSSGSSSSIGSCGGNAPLIVVTHNSSRNSNCCDCIIEVIMAILAVQVTAVATTLVLECCYSFWHRQ